MSADVIALLMAHDYPGNVRELKNAMEHGVIMASGDTIEPADLPRTIVEESVSASGPSQPSWREEKSPSLAEMRERWLAPLERRYLAELLSETGGNVKEAAARADVNPVTMYKLLKKRGMSRERRRAL